MLKMKTEKQVKFDSTYTRGSKKISTFRQFSIHISSKISRYDFCVYTSFTIVSHSPFVLENKFWGGNRKLKFWMERSNLKIDNEKFRTYNNSTHFTQIFVNQTTIDILLEMKINDFMKNIRNNILLIFLDFWKTKYTKQTLNWWKEKQLRKSITLF